MGTPVDKVLPQGVSDFFGSDLGKLVGGSAAGGVGGATGAAIATGNDPGQAAVADIAGLGLGAGISALGAPAAGSAAAGASAPSALGTGLTPGAGGATGLTTGATGASGLQLSPAASAAFNEGIALPFATSSGIMAGGAGTDFSQIVGGARPSTPSAGAGGTGLRVGPDAGARLGLPSTPTPPTVTPPPAGGGGFVDSLLKQMKDNALGLGLIGGSMLLAGKQPEMPSQAQLQGLSAEAQQTATQLMAQYRSGQLAAGQQAQLDQITQQTKNQVTQYFASIGQADSTAHQQALAQVDQQAFGMRQQMLDNMLVQGLNAIGVASGPLQTIAQYQLGQDQALRQAYGNFAQGVGNLFGRQAGTQQPQQPAPAPKPTQPTQTVQSAAQ